GARPFAIVPVRPAKSGDLRDLDVIKASVVMNTVLRERNAEAVYDKAAIRPLYKSFLSRLLRFCEFFFSLNDGEMPDAKCDQKKSADKNLEQSICLSKSGHALIENRRSIFLRGLTCG